MSNITLILKLYAAVFCLATVLLLATIYRLPGELAYPQNNVIPEFEDFKIAKKDWHDHLTMEEDRKRKGIGEHGKPAFIKDKLLKQREREISLIYGYNGLLSDVISVNRSLKDLRHKGCMNLKYLASLPRASIIIPFYNEHFSVLIRSIHSLINRSPSELLHEIILVDDASNRQDRLHKLDKYIMENFSKVRIIRLPNRRGLIHARLAGARNATADVLIFLDSHIETNYNWLPPLLEPIALNKRTAVCPFIDVINDVTFAYTHQDEGARGAFNWVFDYKRLPLLPINQIDRTTPFENPVMAGGLFAISSEFFWELGGYDEGLDIWGGEQYELSFKIWMCGGKLMDVPCSRIGHIYKGRREPEPSPRNFDYLRRNYKRVAEVWMDEYKKYLYNHDEAYKEIDAGNVTQQKTLREKLQCKSFKWYMENVAFDLTKTYPLIEPPHYASGVIQSVAEPLYCVDSLNMANHEKIGLFLCSENLTHPQHNQNWALSSHRDIRLLPELQCLTVKSSKPNAPVRIWECLEEGGDQFWYYDPIRQWIIFERNGDRCLEVLWKKPYLVVNQCQTNNVRMRWKFGFVNKTALEQFHSEVPEVSYLF